MTNGEAKVLETDVILFPMEYGSNNQETVLANEIPKTISDTIVKQPVRIDIQMRFARLKKSLPKRSANIL